MNRLILLGNGFDLAHGMKTSYNDFILWYLGSSFVNAINNDFYQDELMSIEARGQIPVIQLLAGKSIKEFLHGHYCDETLTELMGINANDFTFDLITSDDLPYRTPQRPFQISVKSTLLKQMISNCSYKKWVDLENLFYSALKKALEEKNQNKQNDVIELNNALTFLIKKLQEYLSTLDCPGEIKNYDSLLKGQINRDELIIKRTVRTTAKPGSIQPKTLVLNFNYTPTGYSAA